MAENKNETKITMLTIKEAAALVNGMTEYRVRQMCINDQIPHIMAGRKYLINKDIFLNYLRGKHRKKLAHRKDTSIRWRISLDFSVEMW